MALPASGPLSASQISVELGLAAGAAFSLNDAGVRGLAGKPSGLISFSDLLGKSAHTYVYTTIIGVTASPSVAGAYGYGSGEHGSLTPRGFNVNGTVFNCNSLLDYGVNSSFELILDFNGVAEAQRESKIYWLNTYARNLEVGGTYIGTISWSIDPKLLIAYGSVSPPGGFLVGKAGQSIQARVYY